MFLERLLIVRHTESTANNIFKITWVPLLITMNWQGLISGNIHLYLPKHPHTHRTTQRFKHNPEMLLIASYDASLWHFA